MKAKNKLNYCAVETKPINYDWSKGYGETWQPHEACRCDKCNAVLVGKGGGDEHRNIESDSECDGWVEEESGPMMNYYYPLPEGFMSVEWGADAIAGLPLCIVEFMETEDCARSYGLALTGGGMDLSWEICEAFMRLGYFPPAHFAELPAMAGRGESKRDRAIISACRQSLRAIKARATRSLQRLNETFKRKAA